MDPGLANSKNPIRMFWPRLRREPDARPSARGAAFQTRQVTVHDTGKLLKEVDMLRDQLEASNLMVRQLQAELDAHNAGEEAKIQAAMEATVARPRSTAPRPRRARTGRRGRSAPTSAR